jgi:hypothetical protein
MMLPFHTTVLDGNKQSKTKQKPQNPKEHIFVMANYQIAIVFLLTSELLTSFYLLHVQF